MSFHDSSSQFSRERYKAEDHAFALYATPPIQDVGVVTPASQFHETQIRGLEYRTASSFNTTASSGPIGRIVSEMPQKRCSPGEANGAPAKQIKAEHPEEFSNAVKKKLQSSTRTGQACDRCKVSLSYSQTDPHVDCARANFVTHRYAKSDAMDCQEDVPLVCRTTQNVGPQTASLVGQPLEATWRGSNSRTATCNTGFANWSSD